MMSKVIIVRCPRCLKQCNIQYANIMGYTPQCPHCDCYGLEQEKIMELQPEINKQLKEDLA